MQPRILSLTVAASLLTVAHGQAVIDLCSNHDGCSSCAKSSGCTWCRTDDYCFTKGTTGIVCETLIDDDEDCPEIRQTAKIITGVIVGVVAGLICLCVCMWFARRRQLNAQGGGPADDRPPQVVMVPQAYGVGPGYAQHPPTAPQLTPQQQYNHYEKYTQAARSPQPQYQGQPHQMQYSAQYPNLGEKEGEVDPGQARNMS